MLPQIQFGHDEYLQQTQGKNVGSYIIQRQFNKNMVKDKGKPKTNRMASQTVQNSLLCL